MRLASQAPNLTDPLPSPFYRKKLFGFASISGTTSGKSGVDMSTPVHSVATPLPIGGGGVFQLYSAGAGRSNSSSTWLYSGAVREWRESVSDATDVLRFVLNLLVSEETY